MSNVTADEKVLRNPIAFDEQGVQRAITDQGFAWIPRAAWSMDPGLTPHLERLREDWEHLELDRYLEGGAKFRLRRYGRYFWSPGDDTLVALEYEPYFQPESENSYAGGVKRHFGPVLPSTLQNPFVQALVRASFACLPIAHEKRRENWEVRIHQIRIVAPPGEASPPTPEGIHQDGTDFLTLHLLRRDNIEGGESSIYTLERTPILRQTMRDVLDTFILEDPRVMHSVTPVLSADGRSMGTRDIMGIDFHYRPHFTRPS